MDSITRPEMAVALHKEGALGILTRYIQNDYSQERAKQLGDVEKVRNQLGWGEPPAHDEDNLFIATAIGVKQNTYPTACALCELGVNIICLDIANANHSFMKAALEDVNRLKSQFDVSVIAGNVATAEAALRLADCGADTIKVGIGPGAACTTRRVTGFGVPQFSAILDCAEALDVKGFRDVRIIADGGVRHPGDAVKALWAGADTVMLGYVFAGHDECPTWLIEHLEDGRSTSKRTRVYRGMSSRTVSRRSDIAPEGISLDVPDKGPVSKTVQEWAASIRAACSLANAKNLEELRRNVTAIRVSTMSSEESDPVASE